MHLLLCFKYFLISHQRTQKYFTCVYVWEMFVPRYIGYKKGFQAICFFRPVGVSAQLRMPNHPLAVKKRGDSWQNLDAVLSAPALRSAHSHPREEALVLHSPSTQADIWHRRGGICFAERQTHSDVLTLQKSRRQVRSEDTSLPPDDHNAHLLRHVWLTSYSPAANTSHSLIPDTSGEQLEVYTRDGC